MTGKEYLCQISKLDNLINAKLQNLKYMKELVYSLSAAPLQERVQSSSDGEASYTGALQKIMSMEEQINRDIDRLIDTKQEADDLISQLADIDEQSVLRYRYISQMSWEDIASLMKVSLRTTYRLHSNALKNFSEIFENSQSMAVVVTTWQSET